MPLKQNKITCANRIKYFAPLEHFEWLVLLNRLDKCINEPYLHGKISTAFSEIGFIPMIELGF